MQQVDVAGTSVMDPSLWASTPYGNPTAMRDYFGLESFFHRELALRAIAVTGRAYRTYPLGDGGGAPWLFAHQQELVAACAAFGIAAPPDLSSYDLGEPEQFASFHFINSNLHRQLLTAAGL